MACRDNLSNNPREPLAFWLPHQSTSEYIERLTPSWKILSWIICVWVTIFHRRTCHIASRVLATKSDYSCMPALPGPTFKLNCWIFNEDYTSIFPIEIGCTKDSERIRLYLAGILCCVTHEDARWLTTPHESLQGCIKRMRTGRPHGTFADLVKARSMTERYYA